MPEEKSVVEDHFFKQYIGQTAFTFKDQKTKTASL